MVFLDDDLRGNAAILGRQCDRCPMRIATRNHCDVVTFESVVSGENIGWQVCASSLAKVN
jgi:hypothetical protein